MPKDKAPNTTVHAIKHIGVNTYMITVEKDHQYFYGTLVIYGKGTEGEPQPGDPGYQEVTPVLD
jgi:hypothetical protein